MPTYEIWFKKENDGRAPPAVFLSQDYVEAGKLEAGSPKELYRRIVAMKEDDSPLQGHRALWVGDVLRDESTQRAWILTPTLIWAQVEAYVDEVLPVSDS